MQLPLTLAAVSVTVLDEATSTNDVLAARGADGSHFDTVLTTSQTAGRGRLGRTWTAPPGTSLAMSILIRPIGPLDEPVDIRMWGWLPLLAGLAMSRTVAGLLPGRQVGLKWPNDVLVGNAKVSGILSELLFDASGVVVGAGLNLSIGENDLPTGSSTSLILEGCTLAGDELIDTAASRYLSELRTLVTAFLTSGGDVESTALRSATATACSTIGRTVRVELPNRPDLLGSATGLDRLGRLVVHAPDGTDHHVAAGDVTHLRVGQPGAPIEPSS